jgi:hypothetical protein
MLGDDLEAVIFRHAEGRRQRSMDAFGDRFPV